MNVAMLTKWEKEEEKKKQHGSQTPKADKKFQKYQENIKKMSNKIWVRKLLTFKWIYSLVFDLY